MRAVPIALMLLIAACSGNGDDPDEPVDLAANGVPLSATPSPPDATGPGTALGLTELQLEDADLVDAQGRIGEVERIDKARDGTVRALVIELDEGVAPDRLVRIGLDGLSVVPDGDDWNLRTTTPRDALARLPAVAR